MTLLEITGRGERGRVARRLVKLMVQFRILCFPETHNVRAFGESGERMEEKYIGNSPDIRLSVNMSCFVLFSFFFFFSSSPRFP